MIGYGVEKGKLKSEASLLASLAQLAVGFPENWPSGVTDCDKTITRGDLCELATRIRQLQKEFPEDDLCDYTAGRVGKKSEASGLLQN